MDTWRFYDIVHLVHRWSSRGYNGTDIKTCCGTEFVVAEKWIKPQREVPNCIACLTCQQ